LDDKNCKYPQFWFRWIPLCYGSPIDFCKKLFRMPVGISLQVFIQGKKTRFQICRIDSYELLFNIANKFELIDVWWQIVPTWSIRYRLRWFDSYLKDLALRLFGQFTKLAFWMLIAIYYKIFEWVPSLFLINFISILWMQQCAQ